MARQVHLAVDDAAMQPLIEEEIAGGQILPGREGAGRCAVELGLGLVMDVMAGAPGAAPAIFLEDGLQQRQLVRLGGEMGEVGIAAPLLLGDPLLHAGAVIFVEGVALDEGGRDALALEDLLEGLLDRGGAGPGRAGDDDDGVPNRHRRPHARRRPRRPNSGARVPMADGLA